MEIRTVELGRTCSGRFTTLGNPYGIPVRYGSELVLKTGEVRRTRRRTVEVGRQQMHVCILSIADMYPVSWHCFHGIAAEKYLLVCILEKCAND